MIECLTVVAGGARRLFRVADVREVVPMMRLHDPGDAAGCRGLLNLRGEVVPVFDLVKKEGKIETTHLIVVTTVEEQLVGFIVDDVTDVVHLGDEELVSRRLGNGDERHMALIAGEVVPVVDVTQALRQ